MSALEPADEHAWWDTADELPTPRPALSVVIPAFGHPDEVVRAVESVLCQEVQGIEIIVVDDGSRPALALPARLAGRVRMIRRGCNGGAAAARNTGMAAARGRFLTFLDGDDVLLPATLKGRLDAARALHRGDDQPLAIIACGFADVGQDGRVLRVRHPKAGRGVADFAAGCWFNPGSCVIVRHPDFVRTIGFQDAALPRLEDLDWFLRASLAGASLVADGIVGASIARSRSRMRPAIETAVVRIQEKWRLRLPAVPARRLAAYLALERAAAAWSQGARVEASMLLARSLLLVPRLRLQLGPGWRSAAEAGATSHP